MGADYDIPEVEVVQDPFTLDIDIGQAIRIIQKNDRGRQGRYRICMIQKQIKAQILNNQKREMLKQGKFQEKSAEQKENEAAVFI